MQKMSNITQKNVDKFIATNDIANYYRQYGWKNDRWTGVFSDILLLEQSVGTAARDQQITKSHILKIAQWGGLPNTERIQCLKDPLVLPLYDGMEISMAIKNDPLTAVRMISQQTTGIGPTYISKVLRFAAPTLYGAIDSRLVRVFGAGDPKSSRMRILNLKANQAKSKRWSIGQDNWPSEFGTWLAILGHIAGTLNASGVTCPHPAQLIDAKLRQTGTWLPADVEMALFSYASLTIYGSSVT
ncbi:MAG: hypothetical protein Q7U51_10275 [Methanoregula sp.]|nr:hypothetical protein [Methanoregula sp.]